MLANVRMSCCVAGNCRLAVKEADVQEALQLLADRLKLPPGAHAAYRRTHGAQASPGVHAAHAAHVELYAA